MWEWQLFERFREIYMKIISKNVPDLKGIDQDKLVSMMVSKIDEVLLAPLQSSQRIEDDINEELLKSRYKFEDLALKYVHQSGATFYHKQFLQEYNISPPSAVAEVIWDEHLIEAKYKSALEKHSPADRAKVMSWEKYKEDIYNPLKKKIDLNFPEGLDRDFYVKRRLATLQNLNQPSLEEPVAEDDIFKKIEPLVKQKESKSKQSPKTETGLKSPQPKHRPKAAKVEETGQSEQKIDAEEEIPQSHLSEANRGKDGEDGENQNKGARPPPPRPSLKSSDDEKFTGGSDTEKETNAEPEALKVEPQLSLLERMRQQAESRERTEKPKQQTKKLTTSYPPIFKSSGWRAYWSNSTAPRNGEWNGWQWACGSFSKDCVSNKISPTDVKRGTDVNQDFLAVSRKGKSIRILMFDGVSQSRAPRQWAETLAQVYCDMSINVPELKKNGNRISEWQKISAEHWNDWIQNEYLPRRTHIPEWRLKNEVKTGHTTFISVEIHEKKIRLANLGDSAVFLIKKDSTLLHLPTAYNHLLRPSNITTEGGYDVEEMEFYECNTEEVESLLVATDSIADYIFGKDEDSRFSRCMEVINNLSSGVRPLEYMKRMIEIGPAAGGWLEDDVSFFTLKKPIESVEEEE